VEQRSNIESKALTDWREVDRIWIEAMADRNCRCIKSAEVVSIGALREVHQGSRVEYRQSAEHQKDRGPGDRISQPLSGDRTEPEFQRGFRHNPRRGPLNARGETLEAGSRRLRDGLSGGGSPSSI
jgi:hypothetical protein